MNKNRVNKDYTILLRKIRRKITWVFIFLVIINIALHYGSIRLLAWGIRGGNDDIMDVKDYLIAKDENFDRVVKEYREKRDKALQEEYEKNCEETALGCLVIDSKGKL